MPDIPEVATDFRLTVKAVRQERADEGSGCESRTGYEDLSGAGSRTEGRAEKILDPGINFHEPASLPYGGSRVGIDGAMEGVAALLAA